MNSDISKLLREWPYESGRIVARFIDGEDGFLKVQVRLDLGIIQMNADGRPDGLQPFGHESLLEYFESMVLHGEVPEGKNPSPTDLAAADRGATDRSTSTPEPDAEDPLPARPDQEDADRDGVRLSPEDCRQLREEAAQYYQRYLALLTLDDFDRVVRDTSRNLRVLDLCQNHAQTEDDRNLLEQFRPYITLARTRALASQALQDDEPKAAIFSIDEGLEAMRRFFADAGQPQAFEESEEVRMLRQMRESLVPRVPVSQKLELRTRLQRAIEQENYELAAILRDELRQLRDDSSSPPRGAS